MLSGHAVMTLKRQQPRSALPLLALSAASLCVALDLETEFPDIAETG